jgi:TIR domain
MATDYEYDVFVSYKREPDDAQLMTPWIDGVVSRLRLYLMQELGGRPVPLFLDRRAIANGQKWPEALRVGIRTSRCILAIWSPEYFHSRWCMTEWKSFVAREAALLAPQHGLVAPIRWTKDDWFPPEAKETQALDLSGYAATTEAFWKTERADELDQKIRSFAADLADVVRRAPPFSSDWPIVEGEPHDPPRGFELVRL